MPVFFRSMGGGAMRIALVDSSRTVLHIVTNFLEAGGNEVRPFRDARAALDLIAGDGDVRVLITSAEPLSMSGLQLCREARKIAGSRRPLYIIVMSSIDNPSFIVQALDDGADDFIHKPPGAEELRARMRAAERLTGLQLELLRLAATDPLTGLRNRRAFFEGAEEIAAKARRRVPVCAIVVDVDRFKAVNDNHGHQVGDVVLRGVAKEIGAAGGISGRLGGEEFCILVEASLPQALAIAESLREGIRDTQFPAGSAALAVTCSFGAAAWEYGSDLDQLLRRADMALYQAKVSGRDRVVADGTYAKSPMHGERPSVTRSSSRAPAASMAPENVERSLPHAESAAV